MNVDLTATLTDNAASWNDFPSTRGNGLLALVDTAPAYIDRLDFPFGPIFENLNNWSESVVVGIGIRTGESINNLTAVMAGIINNQGWRDAVTAQFFVPADVGRVVSDSMALSDTAVFAILLPVAISDNAANLTDLVQPFFGGIFPVDTLTLSDAISFVMRQSKIATDSMTPSDAFAFSLNMLRSFSDSTNSMAQAMTGQMNGPAWQDFLQYTPLPVDSTLKTFSDAITMTDAVAIGIGLRFVETVTLTQAMNATRNEVHWKDSVAAAFIQAPLGLAVSDTIDFLADAKVVGRGLPFGETLNSWADSGQVAIYSDSNTHWTDSLVTNVINDSLTVAVSDVINWADSTSRTLVVFLTQNCTDNMSAVGWVDAMAKSLGSGFISTAPADDANNLTDSASVSLDVAFIHIILSDTNVNAWLDEASATVNGTIHIKIRAKAIIRSISVSASRYQFIIPTA